MDFTNGFSPGCQRTDGLRLTGRSNDPQTHNYLVSRVTGWLTAKAAEDCAHSRTIARGPELVGAKFVGLNPKSEIKIAGLH